MKTRRTPEEKAALWDAVARMLKADPTPPNHVVARVLETSKRNVARVRADLGIPPAWEPQEPWTVERWDAMTVRVHGGHRRWRGRTTSNGVPIAGKAVTAYQVGFRLLHGREPVGRVLATCSLSRCVEALHRDDEAMRDAWPEVMPAEASWRGMDLVAVRKALLRPGPHPVLKLDERRCGAWYAPADMTSVELSRRLGCSEVSAKKWRRPGAGG